MAGRQTWRDEGPSSADSYGPPPDLVKQYVHFFYRHIRERNVPEIQSMYEVSWNKLSDRYYKSSPWPAVELIADVVDQDHVFCLLYKELYFRHLYAKCAPDLRQRCESWDTYCDLFGVLLHSNVNMQLPNIWLWDMIDEFIYQFQSFCQFRGKISSKTPEELELLKQCDKVWNPLEVLNVLQALVTKSGIVAELEADGGAKLYSLDGYYPQQSNVLRMLGYFSLVGLLRVHTLIGDYRTALKACYPLNPHERTYLFTPKIAGANIAFYYYSGFSYLMMRRYTDAVKVFNTVLGYINRVKQYHTRQAAQYDQILKKNEQMYALLGLAVAMSPATQKLLDENVANGLREKVAQEKFNKMARGDVGVYDELFSYACPKFITATPPQYDNPAANTNQLAYRAQLNLFLQEVKSQQMSALLKQYLILYSSISMAKLASLMDVDEAALRTQLMCLKSKSYNLRWTGGTDATAGSFASASDIDFYLDSDPATGREMVIVSESVHTRHHADFLARHISKFEEIVRDLESTPHPGVSTQAPTRTQAAY